MSSYLNMFFDAGYGDKITKLAKETSTFNVRYGFWRDALFERVMRLFVWDTKGDVPPKEIESRLLLTGHCGITKLNGKLTAVYGTLYGVTDYQDEFTDYNYWTPKRANKFKIGKQGVVIDNNALRNPVYPLIHNYAVMLAHAEVSLINALVNVRDEYIPIVQTQAQLDSVKSYQAKRFNGQYGQVKDPAFLGVDFRDVSSTNSNTLTDIYEIRRNLLYSFYEDIGIKTNYEKSENMTEAEVGANDTLLLLNLSDMLDSRKRSVEAVNEMYGTEWTVDLVDILKYRDDEEGEMEDAESESDL